MERLINSIGLLYRFRETQKQGVLRLLELSNKIKSIRKNFLSTLPHHINVISIAARGNLKETAHSAILQQIIGHQVILDSFIKEIAEIDDDTFKTDQVRPAESERMDVSIYGKDRCIIIENKVNGADEQPGQIFRYVQNAIKNKEHHYKPENIKVVYLNPSDHNPPSEFSLSEDGLGKNRVAALVIENMIIKDYSDDIYNWIKGLQNKIPEAESYLRSALYQYQDYLEEKFELTDKYEPMKQEVRKLINEEIFKGITDEDDKDLSQRIKILEEAQEDLALLNSNLIEYCNELKSIKIKNSIEKELKESGLDFIDLSHTSGYDDHNFGFRISLNGKIGYVLYGGPTTNIYIGFGFDNKKLSDSERAYLISLFEEYGMKNKEVQEFYPCFNYISLQTLQQKYIEFAKFIIKKAKEPQEEVMKLEIIG